jgi:hypothetical protein
VLVPNSEPTDGNTGWHVSTQNLGTPSAYVLSVTASCAAGAVVTGGGYSLGGS